MQARAVEGHRSPRAPQGCETPSGGAVRAFQGPGRFQSTLIGLRNVLTAPERDAAGPELRQLSCCMGRSTPGPPGPPRLFRVTG